MSKLTEVNLVKNIIKKTTPSWIAPNYECEWKEPLGTKKQWIQWIQRDDICYTCDQAIVPTDSFEVSSTFAATYFSFIHSFICTFSDFPINCKGFFFVFRSISNTVNVNKPLSIFLHSTWHFCSRSAIWEEENDVNGEIMLGNTPRNVIPRYTKIYGCICTSLLHYN